jgi:hypothetical protein
MASVHFGISEKMENDLEMSNLAFAVIFTAEAVVKILGLQSKYFSDGWNVFDFIIVVVTNIGLAIKYGLNISFGPVAATVRAVRICRILRLINKLETLKLLFQAMINALPSLGNVASLLFLMYYIFASLGVQLFAKTQLGDNLDVHANFQSFGKAILTVMRCSTGEFWNGIMYDTVKQRDGCVSNPPYNSSYCGFNNEHGCIPINGCGTTIGYAYFLFFSWVVTFVFVNLFIAVILEGFEKSKEEDEDTGGAGLHQDEFNAFCAMWVAHDKELDWVCTQKQLYKIVAFLEPPMGLGLSELPPEREMKKHIAKYCIEKRGSNTTKQPFHFEDVSTAIARYVVESRRTDGPRAIDPVSGLPTKGIVQGKGQLANLKDTIEPGAHVKVLI